MAATFTHVRDTAKEIARNIRRSGHWRGVSVVAQVEGSDEPEEGEQTIEQKAEFDRNYCCMIVEASGPLEDPCEYVVFDESAFWADFKMFLQVQFGEDVKITHHPGCSEFEFHRPQPK